MQNYRWVSSRERDNFFYTKGQTVLYNKDCHNSLVISNESEGAVLGLANSALIKNGKIGYVIPINQIERILQISKNIIKEDFIFYKKPNSIVDRENLLPLNLEEAKIKIFKEYGIKVNSINEINNKKGANRIYQIDSGGVKFILKYRGKNKISFQNQAVFLNGIDYFPRIIPALNSDLSISFNDNFYGIEEFIVGSTEPLDKRHYFELVGEHIALMHNKVQSKTRIFNDLEKKLISKTDFLNESNIISMNIDLSNNYNWNNSLFLNSLTKLYPKLIESLPSLPEQVIHGDLNRSNLIWNENNVKMIDFDDLAVSKRIKEFIPPLLFKGNLEYPQYIPTSSFRLINGYEEHSKNPLTSSEKEVILNLLMVSLIKLFVIYNIRRNNYQKQFRDRVVEGLKMMGEEYNVY